MAGVDIVENKFVVKPVINNDVIYDAENKRASHIETGLTIVHLRDEPPQERKSHFKLILGSQQISFEAWYDYSEEKIEQKYPDMHFLEQGKLIANLNEKNFYVININADFDRNKFVQVFQKLVQGNNDVYKISVTYSEWDHFDMSDKKEWSCEQ